MPKLYLIGLGLSDELDITLRGLRAIEESQRVFLESYTSVLNVDVARLEQLYNKPVELLYREDVESEIGAVLAELVATDAVYALCVVGDPFGATTHSDLYLRAVELGVTVVAVHNASVLNAVGVCGLQLYRFGHTVSVPFFTENWRPYSFIHNIAENFARGLHTLVLLDIRVREPTPETLLRVRKKYQPARFMSVREAVEQIVEAQRTEQTALGEAGRLRGFGFARLGAPDQLVLSGTLDELAAAEFGRPLHSLAVCAPQLHEVEERMFAHFRHGGA